MRTQWRLTYIPRNEIHEDNGRLHLFGLWNKFRRKELMKYTSNHGIHRKLCEQNTSSNAPLKNPFPNSTLRTNWTKFFGETLHTLAWDRNRSPGLRRDDNDELINTHNLFNLQVKPSYWNDVFTTRLLNEHRLPAEYYGKKLIGFISWRL
jgi:hypothetical protein